MKPRPAIVAAAILAVGVAALVLLSGGHTRTLRIELPTANGLRDGSIVRVGGVKAGTITDLRLGRGDTPEAVAEIDSDIRLGPNTTAQIVTSNLLGSKYLLLVPRGAGRPLPNGATIPSARVTVPTDLDQVLNVLTPDTRARMQILINEAGTWMVGRGTDLNAAMALLPQDLDAGAELVSHLRGQNESLRRLVASSSSLIGRLAPERREIANFAAAAEQIGRAHV